MLARGAELLVDGLARGMILSLLGLGITLVFGLGGILNLVLGVFAVVAVIVCSFILGVVPELLVAGVGGVAAVALFALVVDRSVLSLVYEEEGEDRELLGIFVTLGLSLLFEGLLFVFFADSFFLESDVPSIDLGGASITGSSIAVIVSASVLFGLIYYFFNYTYLGIATRTVIQDETGSILCGIRPRRVQSIVFVLSAAIAGAGGILYALDAEVAPASAFELTTFAIMVSIVGGVDSIRGTVAAGIVLGIIITVAGALFGSYLSTVTLFAAAIAVLIYKPEQIS
ncbi:branched-chain amino acid ABC transporter permease [Halobellus clavatus]|jgi:branched-chain amino acid transport system permease protein|uniref:Branched-chain amino acid transport system permease protein n=1 Tax=Halobellus clavatus TaxID=660517 RepID=A0A1H3H314_9EURY|nr:branched-chain amino acid ABC transporter permease [Halobellus clavatus]SDY09029.1 branched-chain amino acid transport system permease protein [Halobellus clavatus]